jgi:hypothetical protein
MFENVSNGLRWGLSGALGALEPKKKVKAARRRVGLWWKGCRKQPPRAAVFCHLTTGTETYATAGYLDEKSTTLNLFANSPKSRKCQQPFPSRLLSCVNLRLNKVYRADLSGLFIMAAGTYNAAQVQIRKYRKFRHFQCDSKRMILSTL